jgi:hypothetical protein
MIMGGERLTRSHRTALNDTVACRTENEWAVIWATLYRRGEAPFLTICYYYYFSVTRPLLEPQARGARV